MTKKYRFEYRHEISGWIDSTYSDLLAAQRARKNALARYPLVREVTAIQEI